MAELLWKECADWLVRCRVLPPDHRVKWRHAQVIDLANTLRDGVLLCHLLNSLIPGCVDLKEINLRPQMSQFLCLKNIRVFIVACQRIFDLKPNDLFEPPMLFDYTDFGRVLNTLSKLSNCPKAERSGVRGFPSYSRPNSHDYYNDDIYRNLEDIANHNACSPLDDSHYDRLVLQPSLRRQQREEDVYEDLCYVTFKVVELILYDVMITLYQLPPVHAKALITFAVEGLVLNDNDKEIYNYEDISTRVSVEGIYEDLCSLRKPEPEIPLLPQPPVEKRDHCIRELLETEKNYIEVLNMLICHFVRQLKNIIKPEDQAIIFNNIKELAEIHTGFNADMLKACSNNSGGLKLGDCFLNWKDRFVVYGEYCSNLPDAQERVDDLCSKNETVNQAVLQCQMNYNGGKFKLRDLLSVPMQRILKYHLLLSELSKNTPENHEDYIGLKNALDAMLDVAQYINEVKRDHEMIQIITDIQNHITELNMPPNMQLKDYGRLIRDGELRLRSHGDGNKLKSRYIFVFDRVMLICKSTRMMDKLMGVEQYTYKDALVLHEYKVDDSLKPNGRDKWSHCFILVHREKKTAYTMHAKTEDLKNKWVLAFQTALDHTQLADCPNTDHVFNMHTFVKPTNCSTCQKLLCGIFYQGYLCSTCGMSVHRNCIATVRSCGAPSLPPRPPFPIDGCPKDCCGFYARRSYQAAVAGYLSFEQNDFIYVLRKPSTLVWEGKNKRTGEEGLFPSEFVQDWVAKRSTIGEEFKARNSPVASLPSPLPPKIANYPYVNLNLEEYLWYAGKMDHDASTATLDKLPNGAFLVRISERQNGRFVISMKHDDKVKHMRVCNSEDGEFYYLSDSKYFKSIVELIRWYEENSLAESFNGLDVTLMQPYKSLLRSSSVNFTAQHEAISYAIANYEFSATTPSMLSLRKGDRVAILSKRGSDKGWWKGRIRERTGYFPLTYVTEE